MAVTNGWGQAAKNNTNGYGKLATNNIGAGSIYENSYAGDTALIGVSAAFSYSAASFTQADSNPTPTITGNTGGTFSGTSGLVFVSTSTGEINLSASTIAAHVVTYTVDGVSSDFSLSVVSPPYASTRSFSFDGTDDYFEIQNSPLDVLDTSGVISISFWYYTSSTGTGFAFAQKNSGAFELYKTSSWFLSKSGNVSFTPSQPPVILNEWVHVVLTLPKNAGTANFYQNSVSGGQQLYTGAHNNVITISGFPLNIGRRANNLHFFDGLLDEVSIWDSALSSDAVTEIYNSGAPNDLTSLTNASSSNLVAWYKMGE